MQPVTESYRVDPLRAFPPLGDSAPPLDRSSARPALSGSSRALLGSVSELSNSFASVARRGSPIAHRPHDLNDLAREIEIVTLGTWAK